MPTFVTLTAADQTTISHGASHDIKFQPGSGQISIRSAPATLTTFSPAQLSEPALFGYVELLRPDNTAVATASATVLSPSLELSYLVAAADPSPTGNWICRVINNTNLNIDFATDITYVSRTIPLQPAVSLDINLFNWLLYEVAGTLALQVHLESSGDKTQQKTVASWSVAVANLIDGSVEWREHIDDFAKTVADTTATFRLVNLNSEFLTVTMSTNPLRIIATILFNSDNAVLLSLSNDPLVPNIKFSSFQITLTIGFDGTIVPECDVIAMGRILGNTIDFSDDVKKSVEAAITNQMGKLKEATPVNVKGYIDNFFIRLLRLSEPLNAVRVNQAHIQEYTVDGDSLIVSYYLTLEPVVLTNWL